MIEYRTSSFCNLGNCVAVGRAQDGRVAVADTKAVRPPLLFTAAEWTAFCERVRLGEFDGLDPAGRVVPEP